MQKQPQSTLGRLTRRSTIFLAFTSFTLTGCNGIRTQPDPLVPIIRACAGGYYEGAEAEVSARYERLTTSGILKIKAAREAGGTLLHQLSDDASKLTAYEGYIKCIKPHLDRYAREEQAPTVVLIGSKEDYASPTYRMSALGQTSVELLHSRLNNFRVSEFTVSYPWHNEESVRAERPAVIVMHASAFHSDEYKNEAVAKFQATFKSLYRGLPQTKFVVFTRIPAEGAPPDLCDRWRSQRDFLTNKEFQDRLIFYPLPRSESNFEGKAGTEISQIVRCQSGLDAGEVCSLYKTEFAQQALLRIDEANRACRIAIP